MIAVKMKWFRGNEAGFEGRSAATIDVGSICGDAACVLGDTICYRWTQYVTGAALLIWMKLCR
jgi:hypothetical protein